MEHEKGYTVQILIIKNLPLLNKKVDSEIQELWRVSRDSLKKTWEIENQENGGKLEFRLEEMAKKLSVNANIKILVLPWQSSD